MNAARRVVWFAMFMGFALLLADSSARGQDKDSHTIWQSKFTPEQLKEALSRLGGGGQNFDPFRDQILDLMKERRDIDKDDLDRALKLLKEHPELLEHAQRFAKQRQTDPGRPGKLNPEDLRKLFKIEPGQPFQVPDPKGFEPPKINPVQPGNVDPAQPPMPNGVKQPQPPMNLDPPPPPEPGANKIALDENPFPPPENADPRAKSLEAFAAVWERNVGPLSEMPEVRRALFDLVGENGFDFDFKDENGNSIWDMLKSGDGSDFGEFFGGADMDGGGNWFGDWEFPRIGGWGNSSSSSSSSWNWPRWGSSSSGPRPSSGGWGSGGGGFGLSGLAGAWLPFVILLALILAVVIWFQLKNIRAREAGLAAASEGMGPWPIDPRSISTREEVVIAFEYLSVLICGPSAKHWTHNTIADALTDLAATHGETAVMLARLYELARYAPLDEPLTTDEVTEARKLVCTLAGVSY
jgi:hypothetical protein